MFCLIILNFTGHLSQVYVPLSLQLLCAILPLLSNCDVVCINNATSHQCAHSDLEQSSPSEMSRADKEILRGQTSLFLLSMSSVWEMPNTSNLFAHARAEHKKYHAASSTIYVQSNPLKGSAVFQQKLNQ